ncbi:hypothetical protein DPMN_039645 [Dreissena polymorpha]|uniref:Uncharacterized protein n=1 Tax=Dreissena polymorpha TaxID=45954 RepID=A0A9D4CVM8_DREPO|nr:hypothetical protein DPMN_039645 [Dreissena polymorpha]
MSTQIYPYPYLSVEIPELCPSEHVYHGCLLLLLSRGRGRGLEHSQVLKTTLTDAYVTLNPFQLSENGNQQPT